MTKDAPIFGTTLFDGDQARKGYALNKMCFSFNDAGNRETFRGDEEAYIQRCVIPVSRLGNKTRNEAFPSLEKSGREWGHYGFCPQRAYDFLAKKVFTRKVSSNGQVMHFGQRISVLWKWRGQYVQLRLNAKTLEWEVSHNYEIVKKYTSLPHLSEERLLNLSVFQ